MLEKSPVVYEIGNVYSIKLGNSYYRVTLMHIDYSVKPPFANVVIREHSVDSFIGLSSNRRRHTKKSEFVPCKRVPLESLY